MIRNYFKIAFRNLMKYKFISFINLFGLTIGLTCCLLILSYIVNEVSYDRFQPDANRVYRITRGFKNPQTGAVSLNLSTLAPAFGPLLQNDFREIEEMTRLIDFGPLPVKNAEKMFNEQNTYFADDHLFNFFKVDLLSGDKKTALTVPYSVLLSEGLAKKYFGNEDPVNKIIRVNIGNYFDFRITGVYKDFPFNTHLHPQLMMSFTTLRDSLIYGEKNLATSFGNNSFFTFVKLPANYNIQRMEDQFPSFLDRNLKTVYAKSAFKPSQNTSLALQKITDIHLQSHTDYEAEENGDIKRVYIFSAIALFILLIACINYMNLSTARSVLRAKEIGIRKVSGAQKKEIMFQFLSESVLISWIALLLSLGLTWLLLPFLNQISGQHINISILLQWKILIPVLLMPFLVGIVSGLYPALVMSSFQPVKVLKGFSKTSGGVGFRKALVTIQFAVSIILLICTGVVFSQMNYMQGKALGYDRDHILNLNYPTSLNDQYQSFRNELLSNSNIKNLALSSRIPTGRLLDAAGARLVSSGDTLSPVTANIKFVAVDEDFMNTYGITIAAGRGFSRDYGTDSSNFLINEAAARILNFKTNEEAIGKDFGYGLVNGKLIGVVKDFHFEDLHQKIVPLVMIWPKNAGNYGNISIKLSGSNMPATLAHIEKVWKKFLPDTPFQYNFLDESFNRLYQAEERQRTLFTIFSFLAIFIACLGLFGLSAFMITQRIKEIGIRKVLGANMSSLVSLLSKDFLLLVLIAAVLAFPIAWLTMNKWLQDFAYRVSIQWWIFLLAGVLAAFIAFATISIQAIKAAMANPVKNLRTE